MNIYTLSERVISIHEGGGRVLCVEARALSSGKGVFVLSARPVKRLGWSAFSIKVELLRT